MPPENRRRRKLRNPEPDTSQWSEADRAVYESKRRLSTPIAEMSLSVRVVNALEDNNVILACDLMRQTYSGLMGMKNFGEKTLTEVRQALRALGLEPPAWVPPPKEKPSKEKADEGLFKFW